MSNIYVASSWKNTYQEDVVDALRSNGHYVYFYKEANSHFHWKDVFPEEEQAKWTAEDIINNVFKKPKAQVIKAYRNDFYALQASDACVLVLPSGRSAHLEAGYAVNKKLYIYMPEPEPLDLMYLMARVITDNIDDLIQAVNYKGAQFPNMVPTGIPSDHM